MRHNDIQPGDNSWTFGQMLSMLLLAPGIWGFVSDGLHAYQVYKSNREHVADTANTDKSPSQDPEKILEGADKDSHALGLRRCITV